MYPVNQVILGGDSVFSNNLDDIDVQIQRMEEYRRRLQQVKNQQNSQSQQSLIWDSIDMELSPMTDDQKNRLFADEDYVSIYNQLQTMVQNELLNLVKVRIENTQEGKELLNSQLKIVKKLKNKIIEDTNKEMQLFSKFREFSKNNPGVTYDEFLRNNM